jgi:competence protein ComEA
MEAPDEALARLDPAARLKAGGSSGGRPRLRLGVGAAVVLLIAALITAVIVSAVGQQAGRQVIGPAAAGTDTATTDGTATDAPAPEPRTTGAPGGSGQADDSGARDAAGAIIFVHVLGAVRRSGLFELREGARVMDAVAAAGGLTETADPAGVNLARRVADGEQLYVPALGEAQPGAPPGDTQGGTAGGTGGAGGGAAGGGPAVVAGKVNLNSATTADLEDLPRIGPAMAQRIIDYREANGRFTSVDELRNVTGIGEKTFDGLKDLVTV